MKVLHLIAGGDAGGAKTHVLNLLTQLHPREEIALACLGDGVLAREARGLGLKVQVLPGSFFSALAEVKALGQTADILHCHGSRANLTGALAKKALPCPVISTIHSDHRLDYLGRPAARLSYGTLNARALRRMDALFCVSQAMKDLYARRGFAPERLYAVYNGVDFAAPTAPVDRTVWFGQRNIPVTDADVVVGTAARLHPVKDLPTLLRGFARAAETAPILKLVVAGSGPEETALKTLTQRLGLTGRVFFPGWQEDMEGFYGAVDVSVLTSLSETFPYALTDAARYRKPVAATAVGGIPELVEDGVNGFLFPPGDEETLARALIALCDENRRRSMGQALWEKASRDFSLAATAEAQRMAYRAILAGN